MHNFEWQWKVNCWCVFWLFLHLFYHPSVEKERKKQFFWGQNWREWQFEEVPDTTPQISEATFFSWTDTAIIIKFSQIKSDIRKEVGNLRNRKGKGSLTTFFLSFWLLMSMIESFKLMSTASERASKRASVLLEKHTGCPSKFWAIMFYFSGQYFVFRLKSTNSIDRRSSLRSLKWNFT